MSKTRDLKEQIKDLRREAEFQTRKHLLEVDNQKQRAEVRLLEQTVNAKCQITALEAHNAEVEKRWDSSIQKQQDAIIKALIVKLPAVDLKGVTVNVDGKGK